jgi:hypothetical protein
LIRPSEINGGELYRDAGTGCGFSASPALDDHVFESPKILYVRGHDDQVIDAGNRRNLSVRCGRRATAFTQTRAFTRVPGRRLLVVRKDRQNASHDLFEIRLDGAAFLRGGQPSNPKGQLMPNDRTCREFPIMFGKGIDSVHRRDAT